MTSKAPKRIRTARLTINILPSADEQLKALAELQGRSRTNVLERLIAEAYEAANE